MEREGAVPVGWSWCRGYGLMVPELFFHFGVVSWGGADGLLAAGAHRFVDLLSVGALRLVIVAVVVAD